MGKMESKATLLVSHETEDGLLAEMKSLIKKKQQYQSYIDDADKEIEKVEKEYEELYKTRIGEK